MTRLTLALLLFSACAQTSDPEPACTGGKCDGNGGGTCEDPRYGDGVCQPQLSCAVPDSDCFVTFDSDAATAQWFTAFEQLLASEEGRAPRAFVAEADPRFQKARALLDRGWEAFRTSRPVGSLWSKRPGLVVLEDTEVNAFVVPDLATNNSAFAVIVQTALLETGASDDELLGVMMHELQHAVGLHVIPSVSDELRTFYIAEGREPIGREQAADPRAEKAGKLWREVAVEVGPYSNGELLGMPLEGQLERILSTVLSLVQNDLGCVSAGAFYRALRADLETRIDPNSGALRADAALTQRVTQLYNDLRNNCLDTFAMSFVEVVAQISGNQPAEIEAALTPADLALVKGKHVLDAIWALGLDRRAQLRQIEHDYSRETLSPWSTLRFFSYEEDADDVSVTVLREAGLAPDGLAGFFLATFTHPSCAPILESGEVPPYGVDLRDEHHAACWRADHLRRYAKHTAPKGAARRAQTETTLPARRPLLPPRVSDRIRY